MSEIQEKSDNNSRRNFLKNLGLLGAGTVAGSSIAKYIADKVEPDKSSDKNNRKFNNDGLEFDSNSPESSIIRGLK